MIQCTPDFDTASESYKEHKIQPTNNILYKGFSKAIKTEAQE
jgi:hypothetical protein